MTPDMKEPDAPSGSAASYVYYDYGCSDYDYEYVEDMESEPSVAPKSIA